MKVHPRIISNLTHGLPFSDVDAMEKCNETGRMPYKWVVPAALTVAAILIFLMLRFPNTGLDVICALFSPGFLYAGWMHLRQQIRWQRLWKGIERSIADFIIWFPEGVGLLEQYEICLAATKGSLLDLAAKIETYQAKRESERAEEVKVIFGPAYDMAKALFRFSLDGGSGYRAFFSC